MIKITGNLDVLHATGKAPSLTRSEYLDVLQIMEVFFPDTFLKELTDEGIDIIFDGVNQAPDPRIIADSNIYITSLGGKIKEIPAESSPYPFRQAE